MSVDINLINIPVVIIAGGKSSRMGRDKALLPFGNYETLVQFQYERLKKIFKDVYISWKNEKIAITNNNIFDLDEYKNISAPTIALLSIIRFFKEHKCYFFVLSVDTPFFPDHAFKHMFESVKNINCDLADHNYNEIIVSSNINGVEPLIAIYSTTLFDKVLKMVLDNNHSLNNLIENSINKKIYFETSYYFNNLNYQDDYNKGLLWLAKIQN